MTRTPHLLASLAAGALLLASGCSGGNNTSSSGSTGSTTTGTSSSATATTSGGTSGATTGAGTTGAGTTTSGTTGATTGTTGTTGSTTTTTTTSTSSTGTTGTVAPTISAFTATPNSLPYGGGQTTLTWTVQNATSLTIDQGVGDVTSQNQTTASVTQSTTFTLTASNAVGTVTATALVTVVATTDLSGQVLGWAGTPEPNVVVYVPGHTPTQSDSSGNFTIAGVTPPYEIIAVTTMNGSRFVDDFVGLSDAHPVLWPEVLLGKPGNSAQQTVSGTLSNVLVLSSAGKTSAWATSADPLVTSSLPVTNQNQFSGSVAYVDGGPPPTVSIQALQQDAYPDGGIYFPTYGRLDGVTLDGGAAVSGLVVPMNFITNAALQVQTNLEPDAGTLNGAMYLVGDNTGPMPLYSSLANLPEDQFSLQVPQATGVGFTLLAVRAGSAASLAMAAHLQASTPASLEFVGAPSVVSPLAGATGVSAQTVFSWTPGTPAGSSPTYLLLLQPSGGSSAPSYYIYTRDLSAKLPDLSALGVSVPSNQAYTMWVYATDPEPSITSAVVDLVSSEYALPSAPNQYSLGEPQSQTITTAP